MQDYRGRITVDPAVRSGKPTIRGTRITVADILEYLAGGMSREQILADFPELTSEDILAVLAFAAKRETGSGREMGSERERGPHGDGNGA